MVARPHVEFAQRVRSLGSLGAVDPAQTMHVRRELTIMTPTQALHVRCVISGLWMPTEVCFFCQGAKLRPTVDPTTACTSCPVGSFAPRGVTSCDTSPAGFTDIDSDPATPPVQV